MSVACNWIINFLIFVFIVVLSYSDGDERVTYVHTEHPRVPFCNPKYFSCCNLTANRHNRHNKIYYVNLLLDTKTTFGNNVTVNFYFYQWLTNKYTRSFVEMHFGFCDLIHKDQFFGVALKQGKLDAPCPYPPDQYHMYNMTILPDAIPLAFPFNKGRIVCNISNHIDEMAHGYIDFEIRYLKVKERTKNTKL